MKINNSENEIIKLFLLKYKMFYLNKKELINKLKQYLAKNGYIKFYSKLYLIIIFGISNLLFVFFGKFFFNNDNYGLSFEQKMKDYNTKNFSIIRRFECPKCGFFSFYIVYLGCMNKLFLDGRIPIADLKSFSNAYNGGNISINNPWEQFFYQPYNYTLDEVVKYAKNYNYYNCSSYRMNRPNEINIYYNENLIFFWHKFANNYSPIKKEIMQEAKSIYKELFGYSKNILGVKIRGTDYISRKPNGHSVQPDVEKVLSDVINMDKKYKYDFIFFATEDEIIKQKFIKKLNYGNKLKLLNPNVFISYNYTKNRYKINSHKKIYGNLEYTKNYVLNIIILSKCLDLVASRCTGTAGIFILTKGFRHSIVYNLGMY